MRPQNHNEARAQHNSNNKKCEVIANCRRGSFYVSEAFLSVVVIVSSSVSFGSFARALYISISLDFVWYSLEHCTTWFSKRAWDFTFLFRTSVCRLLPPYISLYLSIPLSASWNGSFYPHSFFALVFGLVKHANTMNIEGNKVKWMNEWTMHERKCRQTHNSNI